MKQHHADYIAEQLEKGGLLLWVRRWDPEDEAKAVKILSAHSAHDVHIHALSAKIIKATTQYCVSRGPLLSSRDNA